MTSLEDIKVELEEQRIHEASKLANDAMKMLYTLDRSGKMLALFIKRLCAISKLKSYCIDNENQLYAVTKSEYEKLKYNVSVLDIDLEKFRYSLVGDGYLKEEVDKMSSRDLEIILSDRIKRYINDGYNKAKRYGLLD